MCLPGRRHTLVIRRMPWFAMVVIGANASRKDEREKAIFEVASTLKSNFLQYS